LSRPRVGITVGDPAGIGPEIAVKAADHAAVLAVCEPVLYGPSTTQELAAFERGRVSARAGKTAYDAILAWFVDGNKITLSDEQGFAEFFRELQRVPRLADTARKHVQARHDQELAFWMEMILEGLHQALRLAREDLDSTITFQELMKFNVLRTVK